MTRNAYIAAFALLLLGAVSCCDTRSTRVDLRDVMLRSSVRTDPDWPDGRGEELTRFAYLGSVGTRQGDTLRIVFCTSVLTGMPSPRGKTWISVFRNEGAFAGRVWIDAESQPLWCEGSRLFFLGVQRIGGSEGNVLDFADGFDRLRLEYVSHYGSWAPERNDAVGEH